MPVLYEWWRVFGRDEDECPPTDGEQFDAVGRFEEPEEPAAGQAGEPAEETNAPQPGGEDVHPRIKVHFWLLVGVFNVALLGVSIGVILATLGEDRTLGGQLFVAGALLFVYGIYRYRNAKAEVEEIVDGEDSEWDSEENQGT